MKRTIGAFVQEEICKKLKIHIHMGLSEDLQKSKSIVDCVSLKADEVRTIFMKG